MRPRLLLPLVVFWAFFSAIPSGAIGPAPASPPPGEYVLIGWNDLGMHCSNKNFADLAVLPPYNTFWATLIHRSGTGLPEVVGTGFSVTYSFEDNTYSVGKTDFWSWEDRLFGVYLPDNIGLTGRGLTGPMDLQHGSFRGRRSAPHPLRPTPTSSTSNRSSWRTCRPTTAPTT